MTLDEEMKKDREKSNNLYDAERFCYYLKKSFYVGQEDNNKFFKNGVYYIPIHAIETEIITRNLKININILKKTLETYKVKLKHDEEILELPALSGGGWVYKIRVWKISPAELDKWGKGSHVGEEWCK